MEAFSRGIPSSSHCIQWSQEPGLLSRCSCVKLSSSLVGPLPYTLRLQITYRPGKHQGKADALSQRSYLAPRPAEPAFDNQKQVILGPARLQAAQVFDMPMDSDVINTIREDLKTAAFAQVILAQLTPLERHVHSHNHQVRTIGNSNIVMDYSSLKNFCMFLTVLAAFE